MDRLICASSAARCFSSSARRSRSVASWVSWLAQTLRVRLHLLLLAADLFRLPMFCRMRSWSRIRSLICRIDVRGNLAVGRRDLPLLRRRSARSCLRARIGDRLVLHIGEQTCPASDR